MIAKIVVAASGSGSNFQSLIDAIDEKRLHAEISGLIASKPGIGAISRAISAGIPYDIVPTTARRSSELLASELLSILKIRGANFLVLAGFLLKIPDSVIKAYPNQIINIHPSLLPKFGGKGYYGLNVHRAVIEGGETESGCTVHLVNEHYDEGRILAQKKISVLKGDLPETLAARILKEEHKLYPAAVQQYIEQFPKNIKH
ncbi:MAG: phosphoribosylglycinamide formyltransferase [Balneolales bacterium]|nr:phosphoribosylglycinamide formyltransferase [Balneolales bacterium]